MSQQPAPPTQPGPLKDSTGPDGFETYQRVVETVAGPSLRIKDNVIQAAIVIGGMILGAIVGFIGWDWMGAGIGAVGMMILGTLLSGLVLMVLGWVRAAKPPK